MRRSALSLTAEQTSDILSRLSAGERDALVALPYRVGLFVSFSDLSGGWGAQEKELETLSSILREFSEDFCKSEFSQSVLMQTLRARAQWPSWSQNIDSVPVEVELALDSIKMALSDKSLLDFKTVLFDIATAVAMAFREDDGESQSSASRPSILTKILGGFGFAGKVTLFPQINVSQAERVALAKLAKALDYKPE